MPEFDDEWARAAGLALMGRWCLLLTKRSSVGGELGEMAPPEVVLVLGAWREIVDEASVPSAVEHHFAAAVQASAGKT
jgi:hypothetical protein